MKEIEGGGKVVAPDGSGDGLAHLRRRLEEGLAELEASSSDQAGAKRSRATFALSHLSSGAVLHSRESESKSASRGEQEDVESLLREARVEVNDGKRKRDALEKDRLTNKQHQQV